jgi:hypothetical protein
LRFTVTATSEGLFAPLEGCCILLGTITIVLQFFLAQNFKPSIVYIFNFPVEIHLGRVESIAQRTMSCTRSERER